MVIDISLSPTKLKSISTYNPHINLQYHLPYHPHTGYTCAFFYHTPKQGGVYFRCLGGPIWMSRSLSVPTQTIHY